MDMGKWWESKGPRFHYNYHKNKIAQIENEKMKTNFEQAEYHRSKMNNYLKKLENNSKSFWNIQKKK